MVPRVEIPSTRHPFTTTLLVLPPLIPGTLWEVGKLTHLYVTRWHPGEPLPCPLPPHLSPGSMPLLPAEAEGARWELFFLPLEEEPAD